MLGLVIGHRGEERPGIVLVAGAADLGSEQLVTLVRFLLDQNGEVEGVHEAELGQV